MSPNTKSKIKENGIVVGIHVLALVLFLMFAL